MRQVREIRHKYRLRFLIKSGFWMRGSIRRNLFWASVFGVSNKMHYSLDDNATLYFSEHKNLLKSRFEVTLEGNNKEVIEGIYKQLLEDFAKTKGATCE